MYITGILIMLFIASFVLAWRSMRDHELPQEVRGFIKKKSGPRGSIVFGRGKVKHYSSMFSSSESSDSI